MFIITITGCYSYKISSGITTRNIEDDYRNFGAIYENCSSNKNNDSISLWQVLTKKAKPFFKNDYKANQQVEIFAMNRGRLKICLLENKEVVTCTVLKGKFIDSAFYVRNRRYFLGFPFIYVKSAGYKPMIGIGKNDSLVVDTQQHRFGWILIMTGGYTQPQTFTYAKAN